MCSAPCVGGAGNMATPISPCVSENGREPFGPAPRLGAEARSARPTNRVNLGPVIPSRPCHGSGPIPQDADCWSDGPPFDPSAWLSSLVAIGGGYALASSRKLWLVVDHCPADELTSVMSQVVGHPGRIDAVRATIERRQAGEA